MELNLPPNGNTGAFSWADQEAAATKRAWQRKVDALKDVRGSKEVPKQPETEKTAGPEPGSGGEFGARVYQIINGVFIPLEMPSSGAIISWPSPTELVEQAKETLPDRAESPETPETIEATNIQIRPLQRAEEIDQILYGEEGEDDQE